MNTHLSWLYHLNSTIIWQLSNKNINYWQQVFLPQVLARNERKSYTIHLSPLIHKMKNPNVLSNLICLYLKKLVGVWSVDNGLTRFVTRHYSTQVMVSRGSVSSLMPRFFFDVWEMRHSRYEISYTFHLTMLMTYRNVCKWSVKMA